MMTSNKLNIFERDLQKRLKKQNLFIFGPRQSGKTTMISGWLKDKESVLGINLLLNDVLLKYRENPSRLRTEIEYAIAEKDELFVFIDEIQKCPSLLDEVHFLIEQYKGRVFFILTGSSARKLKRSAANMLGGRAIQKTMHPLTHAELGNCFDLDVIIAGGSLPAFYSMEAEEKTEALHAYVNAYLKEEVLDEALTRNIPAFSRFLTLAAESSGELINYSSIAREAGVSSNTIKEYYQILEDTLLGFSLLPYLKTVRKQLVQHPKFYLFDTGVINQLCGRKVSGLPRGGALWGKLFEHFIVLEIKRFLDYRHIGWQMFFWRSRQGEEVDVILQTQEKLFAIEIKGGRNIDKRDMKGLNAFREEHPESIPVCVSVTDTPFLLEKIPVIPWKMLFEKEYLG